MQSRPSDTRFTCDGSAKAPAAWRKPGLRRTAARLAPLALAQLALAQLALAPLALATIILAGPALAAPKGERHNPACTTPAQAEQRAGAAVGLGARWSDAGALILDDGRRLVPEGIVLPSRLAVDAALPRASASAARTVLDTCLVHPGTGHTDRHGRLSGPAGLICPGRDDGTEQDLATALLRAGAGYAQPAAAADGCLDQRLAAENEARAAGRGIWAQPSAVAQAADEEAVAIRSGLFAVAEGRVLAAGGTRERIFLNFGASWRQDFTAMIEREDFATIMGDSLDPAMLRGTLVRVRGVVRAEGGPAMALRQAGQIALLSGREVRASRSRRDAK
ncbi:hypothetical protein K9U40_14245 [Xanthobacter autotrophicus]|uniref:hypothetical protein n=1 Tax=Xanthobacter TaxID=279 RepID=UPI0024AB9A38|nr:hypothetical protein [Xanthobacter autotrophicus]MDI4665481.1 hypothetical protein [Xanthobacter autotrophicus]